MSPGNRPYESLEELGDELEERTLLDYMIENTEGDVQIPYRGDSLDEEAYVQAVMDIHFDETYGTPFWRDRMQNLGFDPREEIDSLQDLSQLGEADEEALVESSVEDFMPRLFADQERGTWESYQDVGVDMSGYDMSKSSGSTGKKKVMPWRKGLSEEVADWYDLNFEIRDISDEGNWLIAGPPGLYEKQITKAAENRGEIPFFSGIETRKLKPQTKELGQMMGETGQFVREALTNPGKVKSAVEGLIRMKYTMQVVEEDMESEEIGVMASAPQLVDRAYEMLESDATASDPEDMQALLLSGMGVDEDTINRMEQNYQNAEVIPMYATSFTGANFDNPRSEDLEYHSISPFITFDVVEQDKTDFSQRDQVDYGERGQVVLNHLSEGFLWPNQTERETAERRKPTEVFGSSGDGIADIEPLE